MNHLRKSFFLITILFVGFFLTFPAVSTYGQWASTYGGIGYDSASSIQQTQDGGYIVAGGTASFGAGYNDAWLIKLDSTGEAAWQKTYGGENYDTAYTIQQTQDGGYIMGGYTDSFGAGGRDAWILKLDNTGAATWQKTYGSTGNDYVDSMQQTSDGGYIVAGDSDSIGSEKYNAWVMKLDGAGLVTWQKTYGSINSITPTCIQQTQDGGYIVAGYTDSFGAGYNDAWVMKLDGDGLVTWQKAYGGIDSDYAYFIQQTQDGGYIVAGGTASFGAGNIDVWILKLDGAGLVTWQKTYGSTDYDTPTSIRQTQDGGYIVAGGTISFGAGDRDIWVMKLGTTGAVSWQKTYGSVNYDHALSIQRTQDGGYIAAGVSHSSITHSSDAFILKLDSSGSAGSCPFECQAFLKLDKSAIFCASSLVPHKRGLIFFYAVEIGKEISLFSIPTATATT